MSSQSASLLLSQEDAAVAAPFERLRVGQRPRWSDWRDGRFFERSAVFPALWQAFDEWRKRAAVAPAATPVVFCVCGREGDGKSVLLLQLAAEFLRQSPGLEARLWEDSDDLSQFDNPAPEDVAWHIVHRLPAPVHGSAGDRWIKALSKRKPCFLVTTATPGTLDWFSKKYPKKFELTVWSLPRVSQEEAALLADKTGGLRAGLWREGDTLEQFLFALRHGKRVGELGSALQDLLMPFEIECLNMVWAANALGVPAPASLLKDEHRAAVRRLADEGLLPVEVSESELRLITPGLALPLLYRWFPDHETFQHQVAEGFVGLVEVWSRQGGWFSASCFLRRLLHSGQLAILLHPGQAGSWIRDVRKNLFREIYAGYRNSHGGLPPAPLLDSWMEVGQTFRLRPDVMEDAAALLETKPESLTAETVVNIWLNANRRHNPLAARLRASADGYFKTAKADLAAPLVRLYDETDQNELAFPILARWLENHATHPRFGDVLGVLFAKPFGKNIIHKWAAQCLQTRWRGQIQPLFAMLRQYPENGPIIGQTQSWVAAHIKTPEAAAALSLLLAGGKAPSQTVGCALLWAAHFPVSAQAESLWDILLTDYRDRHEVRQTAMTWLRECPQHPHAAQMVLALARSQKNNPDFIPIVLRWIANNPEHALIVEVLDAVAASVDESVRLALGRWLDSHAQHPSAADILKAVLCAGKISPDWMRRAETVIAANRSGSLSALRALIQSSPSDNVVKLAIDTFPNLPLEERKRIALWLGELAGRQPEEAASLRQRLPNTPEAVSAFLTALLGVVWSKQATHMTAWVERGFVQMGEGDQQWLLERLFEKREPLPDCFGKALALWLQRNSGRPRYAQMVQALRQRPEHVRSLHTASLLPLKILGDLTAQPRPPAR